MALMYMIELCCQRKLSLEKDFSWRETRHAYIIQVLMNLYIHVASEQNLASVIDLCHRGSFLVISESHRASNNFLNFLILRIFQLVVRKDSDRISHTIACIIKMEIVRFKIYAHT